MAEAFHHIHIVGCSPRSGTTLMQEMMVSCFEIDQHCEHERSVFKAQSLRSGVLCTKHPREMVYMPCVLHHNQDVVAIYVVRDPRDVVVSHHRKHPGRYYSNLRFWLEAERSARQLRGNPRFVVVRYEDLVTDPDRVQQDIERAMPFLRRRHAFSEFHLHARISEQSALALNGVRPVDSGSIGRWRQHLERVAAQIRHHGDIADMLIQYGYEPDRRWQSMLPENPVWHDSVIPDDLSLFERLRMAWRVRRKCINYSLAALRRPASNGKMS